MNRTVPFGNPLLLGFEHIEALLERARGSDGHPPYNIETREDGGIRITLAVAGFAKTDLSVTEEDRQLVIRGRQGERTEKAYLHRGIAGRSFVRSFVLADGVETVSAVLEHGLLIIDLARPTAKPNVRVVEIRNGAAS